MASGGNAADQQSARVALQLMDLTSLGDRDTEDQIRALCAQALGEGDESKTRVAAVCVWPRFVPVAKAALGADPGPRKVTVATVVNFPRGDAAVDVVVEETRAALKAGADEIDLVFPYQELIGAFQQAVQVQPSCAMRAEASVLSDAALLKEKLGSIGEAMVRAVKAECAKSGAPLKVIIESADLERFEHAEGTAKRARTEGGAASDAAATLPLVELACAASIRGGADFLKTSTGKSQHGGASLQAARTILTSIRSAGVEATVGIKVSGGVRTASDAKQYLELAEGMMGAEWAHSPDKFRFGASGLRTSLLQVMAGKAAPESGGEAAKAAY